MDARSSLAALLAGQRPASASAEVVDAWLEQAREDGVTGLLAERLLADPGTAPALRSALMAEMRGLAVVELSMRAALGQVLEVLAGAGIPALVLKGTALGSWLYATPYLRESSDIDLLFRSRGDAMAAVAALAAHGYHAPYVPGPFAHEILCRRSERSIDLDLHWALSCMPALDALPSFDALQADSIALPGLGAHARGFGQVDALLHACIHRASNLQAGLGDRLKWLYDIHLLAGQLSVADWKAFVLRCPQAKTCGIALDALLATAAAFQTALPVGEMAQLRAGIAGDGLDHTRLGDWRYMEWKNLRALPDMATRLRWIGSRLLPPTGYLREVYAQRDAGRARLLFTRFGKLLSRLTARRTGATR